MPAACLRRAAPRPACRCSFGADPVDVALEGVDLAVVDDKAVGVRAFPAGRGVGGVARVDERHGRLDGGVVEIDEEAAHLRGDQHALYTMVRELMEHT